MKKLILVVIAIAMCSNLFAQETVIDESQWGRTGTTASIGEVLVENFMGQKIKTDIRTGEWKRYYETGELQWVGSYKNGITVGEWKFYYPNGNFNSIVNYKNDVRNLKKGVLHGLYTTYYENGNKETSASYDNGKAVGFYRKYSLNGQLEYEYEEDSDFYNGLKYYGDENYTKAKEFLFKSTQKGNKEAKYYLAHMYQYGLGTEVNLEYAISLYEELCENKHTESCEKLAGAYSLKGSLHYKNKEYDKAIIYYKKVAENGDEDAKFNLAIMYHDGMGTDVNIEYAIQLYKELCDNDYLNACINLGSLYLEDEATIIEEMNSLGASMDEIARWDELKIKRINIYKQALKPFEKANKIEPSEDLSATINAIKSVLEN